MTAVCIYMMASLFMIVAALLEFAVVLIIKHRHGKVSQQVQRLEQEESTNYKNAELQIEHHLRNDGQSNNRKDAWVERNKLSALEKPTHERIDGASFAIFPTLYVLFNAMYWAYYGYI